MKFMHYDLGDLQAGIFVEVALQGNIANVRLLDHENFQNYTGGEAYYFIGGLVQMTPVYLKVPQEGHWHLAVDMEGLTSLAQSTVRLLQNLSPAAQNQMSRLMYYDSGDVREVSGPDGVLHNKYDVFISYVSEDRSDVARPLALFLSQHGVRAGFEEFEIKAGGPAESLDKGLASCRYGIFIISKEMLLKRWRPYDWEVAASKVDGGAKPVFAIWHNVSAEDIAPHSKSLSKKPARWTGINSLESLAAEIASVIHSWTPENDE